MKIIISYFIITMSFVLLLPSCSWLSDSGVFSDKKPASETREVPVRDYLSDKEPATESDKELLVRDYPIDAETEELVAYKELVIQPELLEDEIRSEHEDTISDQLLTPQERAVNKLKNQVQFVFYFTFDSADLNEDNIGKIAQHARFMRDYTNLRLRLEGHTDERGGRGYNLALGENRALSVREILALYGVEDRIDVISYGEEKPADFGHHETAWQKNRRVELTYY